MNALHLSRLSAEQSHNIQWLSEETSGAKAVTAPMLQAVITLQTQYRMAGDIQSLANELVYCGRLRCGSLQQEQATLSLPLLQSSPQHPAWLQQVGA